MEVAATLDLKQSEVVRAVAGRRAAYAPWRSPLATSSAPADVARGLAEAVGIELFYLADLDAIAGAEPSWSLYEALLRDGRRLWIDAGIGDARRARRMREFAEGHAGAVEIIVALETVGQRSRLAEVAGELDGVSAIFSLDLKDGRPLGGTGPWRDAEPLSIAQAAVAAGFRRLIVLDLAAVGRGQGCATLDLCRRLRERYPHLELASGGGVRDREDLQSLAAAGCDVALVATALHDGRLTRDDLTRPISAGPRGV
ncbi:MAG: hisA/hisF family protein [Planctomycetota bacterium]|nr:MAG: hisA/hisF family protein [Planctomycetota bacterium]